MKRFACHHVLSALLLLLLLCVFVDGADAKSKKQEALGGHPFAIEG